MSKPKGPLLIEMEAPASEGPDRAPPVPDVVPAPGEGRAMQAVIGLGARRRSRLGRFFWGSATALLGFVISVAAWRFVEGLLAANPVLGWIAAILVGLVVLAALLIALHEWAAYARLARLDRVHAAAVVAAGSGDLTAAGRVVDGLAAFYAKREDTAWGRARLAERRGDVFDADALLALAETELMTPMDRAARAEIEAAARQVAMVTAIVPLALADVAAALIANLRMIRRIAEIYGGRAGAFGSWRLLRTVLTHLVATGAVAVGDDLIQSVAGGGLLSKLSRRFGEGVINGALTARVGVAAIEVCRPLPFVTLPKPRVTNLVSRGLAGLFGAAKGDGPGGKS
ncbi:MAG: TIGR01620 family protein [Albidovulum sp.]|uniref:YcjF family protein n=1 Tax=Albidovulum sp. TaxID=1872424 RepID=UPI003CA167F1